MKTSRTFFIVLLVGLMAACSRDLSYEPSTIIVRDLSANEQAVNHAGMDFGFEILQKLSQAAPQENIFISPLSISMALEMTLNGAAGSTETAMRQTLRADDLTETERNEAYQSLIALLMSIDKSIQIEIANSIWIRQGFEVEPAFINTNQDYFGATVQTLDFGNPSTLNVINNWVKQKTHDKIEKILEEIPADVIMYLMNAVYFKGDWAYQFDKELTADKEFHPSAVASSPCKMMIQTNDAFRYFQDETMQAVDLPYGNGQFSMTVLLPAPGLSPQDLLAKMNTKTLQELPSRFTAQRGTLELPKFKLEYEEKLNQVLADMGMGVAFTDAADFTRINKAGGLMISEVRHKTFVQVDEEGTEAAAVTSVGISFTSVGPPLGFFMTVDRPFLFFISEKSTGAVLFMGTVVKL